MKHATIWQAFSYEDCAESDAFFRTKREAIAYLKEAYDTAPGEGGEIYKHRIPLNTDGFIVALKKIPQR